MKKYMKKMKKYMKKRKIYEKDEKRNEKEEMIKIHLPLLYYHSVQLS